MSERLPNELHPLLNAVAEQHFPGFKETDMQFNIGRMEGYSYRGLDLINPLTRERVYLTGHSSEEATEMIRRRLGDIVLPQTRTAHAPYEGAEVDVYGVQPGTHSLIKTLRQSPYDGDVYAAKLARSAGRLLKEIYKLDKGMFGIYLESIAVSHSDDWETDDAKLIVVPPLAEPGQTHPIDVAHYLDLSGRNMDFAVRHALQDGFLGGGRDVR